MKSVFLLQHSYEITLEEGMTSEETKVLGIYSTKEKVDLAVKYFLTQPGFKDYPEDCFYIDEYELNKNEWEDGFISTDEKEIN